MGSDLPILFLTGHGDIPVSVKAIRGWAVNFLTKPVSEDVLLPAVGQALATYEKYIKNNNEAHLGITEKTVKAHRAKIMGKKGVSSAVHLGRVCAQLDITPGTIKTEQS